MKGIPPVQQHHSQLSDFELNPELCQSVRTNHPLLIGSYYSHYFPEGIIFYPGVFRTLADQPIFSHAQA